MTARIYPIDRSRNRDLYRRPAPRYAGDAAPEPPPNFNAAGASSAWWLVLDSGSTYRVECNGRGFVEMLQSSLRLMHEATTYDGHEVAGSMVTVDGKWGPTTTRVLWTALRQIAANPGLLAAVQTTGRTRSISYVTLAAAVWYLTYVGAIHDLPEVSLGQIRLPAAAVPPPWSTLPPGDTSPPHIARITTDVTTPPPPAASDPPPTPPPAPPSQPGATAPAETPEPLAQDTTDDIARPSGIEPTRTASLPWGALAVVAGVAGLAWWLGAGGDGKRRR